MLNFYDRFKMFLSSKPASVKLLFVLLGIGLTVSLSVLIVRSFDTEFDVTKIEPAPQIRKITKPEYVRGIHLTAWVAGLKNKREKYFNLFTTEDGASLVPFSYKKQTNYMVDIIGKNKK